MDSADLEIFEEARRVVAVFCFHGFVEPRQVDYCGIPHLDVCEAVSTALML
jgi:hypothetical protein